MSQPDARRGSPDRHRRRFPRLAIDGAFYARDETSGLTVEVLDVSLGGFQTVSLVAAATKVVHQFRFSLPERQSCLLRGRAVHCRALPGSRPRFVIGWELVPDAGALASVCAIMDSLTSVASLAAPVEHERSSGEE